MSKQQIYSRDNVPSIRISSQTIDDNSRRKSSWYHSISVEPLAFLSILSLYIEFPATQDLFYTKICLQITRLSNESYHSMQLYNNSIFLPISGKIGDSKLITNTLEMPSLSDTINSLDLCSRQNRSLLRPIDQERITDINSQFWLQYQLIICVLCALTMPYWGGMSDKIGRIIPLNVPIVAGLVCNLLSLLFAIFIKENYISIKWLILCAIIAGLSGGQGVVIVNSFGYISDHTSNEDRLTKITILESIIFLGHSVGFCINAQVMKLGLSLLSPWNNKHIVAFALCALLNIICIIYSILKLRHCKSHVLLNSFEREQKEIIAGELQVASISCTNNMIIGTPISIPSEQCDSDQPTSHDLATSKASKINLNSYDRREITSSTPDDLDGPIVGADNRLRGWKSFATLKYYHDVYETLTKPRESRFLLHVLLLAGFVSASSLAATMSLLYNYIRRDPFNWNTSQYSNWNALSSVTRGASLLIFSLVMKFHTHTWDVPDPLVAALGFASKGLGLLMVGLAESTMTLYLAIGAMIFSELTMPPIRSLLSKLVVKDEVCKVYACLATSQNLCFAVGNLVFYFAYTYVGYLKFFKISFIAVGLSELAMVALLA